eukprot:5079200-Pleurochrysis_carterae.AAC.2
MVALVSHKKRAQRGGELVLGCDKADVAGALVHVEERRPIAVAHELGRLEWADQIRAGQLPRRSVAVRLRGGAWMRGALAKWCG